MRTVLLWAIVVLALPAYGAERRFNFSDGPLDQPPPGFRSVVFGPGKAGDWQVLLVDAAPALEPLSSKAPAVSRQAVLAQSGRDAAGNPLRMLLFEPETFGDFKFSTRFKIVEGGGEQTVGLVFHFQNESNFYFAAASAAGQRFQCWKVVDHQVKPPIGPAVELSPRTWHELSVQCEGTRIVCALDGREEIKLIDAAGNKVGKIGFGTRADTVAYFTDARVSYTPRENPAQALVRDALKQYPRLVGLKIAAAQPGGKAAAIVASKDPREVGQPAGKIEQDVIRQGTTAFARDRHSVSVTLPLRDRNGEPIASVCVVLQTFPGQTEDNAFARARPVARQLQTHIQSLEDLLD
jgi:hypothetical protein